MTVKKLLPALTITLAVVVAYLNCLNNDFVWDDEFLIEKNTYLRSFEHLPKMLISNSTAGFGGVDNFYRPTQNIYYLFIFQAFGYSKTAFHAGNIILHLLNSLMLFVVLIRLFGSRPWAWATSLLWALHPTHVEAIGYISGTADPMGLLFFLLALWVLPLADFKRQWKSLFLAWILFVLSLLSKEAMIVAPPLIMLVLALKASQAKPWHWRTHWPSLPFWLTAGIYMVLRKTVLNFNNTYDFYKTTNVYTENILYRVYTYLATLPEYLKILFYPTNLHMERDFPVFTDGSSFAVILGGLIVVVSFGIAVGCYCKKGLKWPLFSWLWFFIAFVPMMGILVPVNSFILEHWLYLPSIGVFIVAGKLVEKLWKSHNQRARWVGLGLLLSSCLSLAILTHLRNRDWATPITFYQNILQYSKGTARVHNNLAMAFSEAKQFDQAITHYKKAIAVSDIYAQTHYNLARVYIQKQNYEKALTHLRRSLEINPNFHYAQSLLQQLQSFIQNQ